MKLKSVLEIPELRINELEDTAIQTIQNEAQKET